MTNPKEVNQGKDERFITTFFEQNRNDPATMPQADHENLGILTLSP